MKINKSFRGVGHFTQMCHDEAYRVGCAISRFHSKGLIATYCVCNFSETNIHSKPVYVSGNAGSACDDGHDSTFSALCKCGGKIDESKSIHKKCHQSQSVTIRI